MHILMLVNVALSLHFSAVSLPVFWDARLQLAYDLTWRENWGDPSSASCSPAVRRELGHSLLSSLRYEYTLDRRDSRLRPSRGYFVHTTSELAGLGPHPNLVRFFRQVRHTALCTVLYSVR